MAAAVLYKNHLIWKTTPAVEATNGLLRAW